MAYRSNPQIFNKVKNGVDGTSVTILGSYDSESALKNAHPTGNAGDSYLVGGNLYVWNGTKWESVGNIQGPKGEDGVDGTNGSDGRGIKSTVVEYQASSSGTSTPTGTWTTTIPTLNAGQYMWTRTTVTYTDNSTSTSYSIGKAGTNGTNGTNGKDGAKGDKGDTGTGVSSVTTQYYVSTKKDSLTGGSWSESTPKWEYGKYLWKRECVKYTDGNETTSAPFCDGTWEAVNDLDAQILAWCMKNDRTHIDGSKIYTGTITAKSLNVTKLSSITADLGTITAGTINSTTINSATINGGTINSSKYISATSDNSQILELNNSMLKFDCVDDLDTWNYQLGLLGLQLNYKYKGASISSSVVGEASLQAMPYHIILKGNTTDKTSKTIFKASIIDETVECYKLKVTNEFVGLNSMIANLGYLGKSAFNKIWKTHTFASSTSMASTGLSVEIPANSYYVMTIVAQYHESIPKKLRVEESPIAQGVVGLVGETGSHISTTVSGYTLENNKSTFTIKAQYESAKTNSILVMGYYITL